MTMWKEVFILLLALNVITFCAYGVDKWKAKHGKWRISEATLLILSAIGGSVGALLGMKMWHHKTQHAKFKYGVPAILCLHIALAIYITFTENSKRYGRENERHTEMENTQQRVPLQTSMADSTQRCGATA